MTDFFREVDEDVRRERILQFLGRFRFLIGGVILLILAGAVGWRITVSHRLAEAEAMGARYQAAIDLAQQGEGAQALAALKTLSEEAPQGYATLARLRAIDETVASDPVAAAGAYAALAEDSRYPAIFRDLAHLRALYLQVDQLDPKVFEDKAAALAKSDFAFRNSARELLALAALKRKDFDAAGHWLDEIVVDPAAPASMRQRAEAFLGLVQAGKPAYKPAPAPKPESKPETKEQTPSGAVPAPEKTSTETGKP
ncbi:tetratricopeptide repeat protein [Beijerinckia indica]|uniref:Ancillary SecYEG translocon subunit/Cell division coordinator CpoB TPR domain-containing protein n=1 Tax=Beijerinckia indica subsp. indica (strain ATCC 9039 / DSM 1715 / NCIMB 8712) TaxID=395963 RepID=B2IHE6_BEII9|nr:tetratricopeptide repeat protein [Beijerinckia indica]ACB95931.1 conserved hypothetical protein [Beijerinckia indica subsp. indica ATCC 9039]